MEVKNSPLRPYWSMPDDHLLGEIALRVVEAHMVDAFFPARSGDMLFLAVRFFFPYRVAVFIVHPFGIVPWVVRRHFSAFSLHPYMDGFGRGIRINRKYKEAAAPGVMIFNGIHSCLCQ